MGILCNTSNFIPIHSRLEPTDSIATNTMYSFSVFWHPLAWTRNQLLAIRFSRRMAVVFTARRAVEENPQVRANRKNFRGCQRACRSKTHIVSVSVALRRTVLIDTVLALKQDSSVRARELHEVGTDSPEASLGDIPPGPLGISVGGISFIKRLIRNSQSQTPTWFANPSKFFTSSTRIYN